MTWTMDGDICDNGTVGGDGAGEATSARFTNPEHPFALFDVNVYTVDRIERGWQAEDDDSARWDIEVQYEWLICTNTDDPGGTETFTHIEYDANLYERSFATEEEALEKRDAVLRSIIALTPTSLTWDGQPFTR